MLLKGIIISAIASIFWLESRMLGQHQLDRPIVICPVIGLVLGDPTTGLVVGGQLELIWNGLVGIGTTTPPDVVIGGALAVTYVIETGISYELALSLAIPISLLGQILNVVVTTAMVAVQHLSDKAADKGDIKGIERTIWIGCFWQFMRKFLIILPGYLLGSEAINAFVQYIPQFISDGLNVASGLLVAVGLALLMQITMDKKFASFLFVGFALYTFLNVSSIGVSMIGVILAVIYFQFSKNSKSEEDF